MRYSKSKYFNLIYNEDGEPTQQGMEAAGGPGMQADPNQVMMDPNAMQAPSFSMLDIEKDEDSKTDKKFPEEKDGISPEQDLTNFVNYQRLLYYDKFQAILKLIEQTKVTFNNNKYYINADNVPDGKQHKIINLLISSLEEIEEQINFFLQKGIATVNIDKTRAIYNAIYKKLDICVTAFEDTVKNAFVEDKSKKKK